MAVMNAQIQFVSARLVTSHSEYNLRTIFQDVTENVNWNKCLDDIGMSLGRCIYKCQNNSDCENDCVFEFKVNTANCPCEVC